MTSPAWIRPRLLALMFLEYFVWGAWSVEIGRYMNGALGFTGSQMGWIVAASALGAMISPVFVGYVADRYFPTERVLCTLHAAGAVCLFLAAATGTFSVLFVVLLLHAVCFMPTLPLANSLSFRNIERAENFPRIIVAGTVGWIVAGLAVGFWLARATAEFFLFAAAAEVLLSLYCLTLPHTPPKGKTDGGEDVLGLSAARYLRRPAFLVFAAAIALGTISATFYTTWMNAFLSEIRLPRPTALMTLSQVSGVVVLLLLPWFIGRIGMKTVLLLGMLAYAVRYVLFASLQPGSIVGGLLLHGFSYDFLIVGASIYAARVVPAAMSARAQSFVALLTFGLGTLAGGLAAGRVGQMYSPPRIVAELPASAEAHRPPLVDGSVTAKPPVPARSVAAEPAANAQRHTWPQVWLWGAALALLDALLFWVGGREPQPLLE